MELEVILTKNEKIEDDIRYMIDDEQVIALLNEKELIQEKCTLQKLEEEIRENFREKGYFYNNNDILKYSYENYDNLKIIAYDNDIQVEDIVHFIKKNDLKQFQKVTIELGQNQYIEIDKFINRDLPEHIVFKLPDNMKEISYYDLIKTVDAVNHITEKIHDLSPLEQIMFLYDSIRERIYCDDENDKAASRELSRVLLGEKIVCLGYANIFNIALKRLGIQTRKETIIDTKNKKGHVRNIVYIDDPKYNIESISFFDLTFDSKKNIYDDSFLQSYAFFAKPLSYFKNKERCKWHSEVIPFFDFDLEKQKEIINSIKSLDDISKNGFLSSMIKVANLCNKKLELIDFMNLSTMRLDCNFLQKNYSDLIELLEKEIEPETFAKCLVEVRKQQQQLNPEKFSFNSNELTTIIHNRYKPEDSKEELLLCLFGEKIFTEEDARKITEKVLGKNNQTSIQKKKS